MSESHMTRRKMTNVRTILVGKTEEKRPLGRARSRLDDNIKIDLKEIECEDVTGSSSSG
jgi:hypothetical protein